MGILSGISWFVGVIKASKVFKAVKIIGALVTLAVGVKGFLQARQMLAKGQDILANKTSAGGKRFKRFICCICFSSWRM